MNINVVGMGIMGYQVSALFYLLGYNVAIYSNRGFNARLFDRQIKLQKKYIGCFTSSSKELKVCSNISEIYDACTIETTKEDINIKKNLYEEVQKVTSNIFFTNTSSIEPREIGSNVVGLHFFNPIHLKLVELTKTQTEGPELVRIINDIKSVGFDIIEVKGNRGYLANYILFNEIGGAMKLIEEHGYSYKSIKSIYGHIYNGRDIFSILDIIGLDVSLSIFKYINEKDPSIYVPLCLDKAINSGILGKKNKTSILDVLGKINK